MILTREHLENEGYRVNGRLSHGFYLLADGTTWNGQFEHGGRELDHREVEAFTTLDRYDGDKFWNYVTFDMGLILLVPECKEIQINPYYIPTEKQAIVINSLKKLAYTEREFK